MLILNILMQTESRTKEERDILMLGFGESSLRHCRDIDLERKVRGWFGFVGGGRSDGESGLEIFYKISVILQRKRRR